jgi:hypothetical protein
MEDASRAARLVDSPYLTEEIPMLRIKRLVPTVALTLATATLIAPAAGARPIAGVNGASAQSALAQSAAQTRSAGPVHDTPLANPVATPNRYQAEMVRLLHPNTPVQPVVTRTVNSSNDSFDWTAAAIGASVVGLAMIMLASGVGIRRRGRLAT